MWLASGPYGTFEDVLELKDVPRGAQIYSICCVSFLHNQHPVNKYVNTVFNKIKG